MSCVLREAVTSDRVGTGWDQQPISQSVCPGQVQVFASCRLNPGLSLLGSVCQ